MNIGFQDVVKTYDMLDAEGFRNIRTGLTPHPGKP